MIYYGTKLWYYTNSFGKLFYYVKDYVARPKNIELWFTKEEKYGTITKAMQIFSKEKPLAYYQTH